MKKILFLFAAFVASLSLNAQSLKAYSVYDVNQDDKESVSDVTAVVNQVKAAAATDKTVVDTEALLLVLTKLSTDIAAIKAKLCISDDPDPEPSSSNLLPGTFTVAKGKTVQFTKGNLYWDGSAFKFEANQTDGLNTTSAGATWDKNHVSHFYWTKTAANSYAQSYNDGTNSTSDVPFFAESKGGLTVEGTSGLFALSIAEWKYLISTRTDATNLRKYGQTVGEKINCLLIAPDGFDTSKWHSSSSYTLEEVNSLGLVCLPAAGYRYGSSFDIGGSCGRYWSSTPYSGISVHADYLGFNSVNLLTYSDSRGNGQSLRLVALPQ